MNDNELLQLLRLENDIEFKGWNFTYLTNSGRIQDFPLTWNYRNEIKQYIKEAKVLLDMGTGGGEFLDSIEDLPRETYATEGYVPNIGIAKKRLKKRKIEVRQIANDKIPYDSEYFDLVINRHESYSVSEIKRVLKDKGKFITQQVGGFNNQDMNNIFQSNMKIIDWCLVETVKDFLGSKFTVKKQKECITKSRCYDVGALVYYLRCIPWQIPDFTIEKYFEKLKWINDFIEREGYIDFIQHRFLLIVEK